MRKVRLLEEEIPAIALGTWAWGSGINGGNSVFGSEYQTDDLRPVFKKGVAEGFTLYDTAFVYGLGASERILGTLLKEAGNPEDIAVSTKFTPMLFQGKSSMRRTLEGSLKRLGREKADLYWIHSAQNVRKWTKEIAKLSKEGLVQSAGVSNHRLDDVKLAADILAKEGVRLAAVQNHYSLLYRGYEQSGLLKWCKENGVLFFSYMVLEQGVLTGKYTGENPLPQKSGRGKAFNPNRLTAVAPLIAVMNEIGQDHSTGAAEVAIAWSLAKGTVPIIGVTKEHHIDSASRALSISLSDEEILRLERAAESTGIVAKAAWEPSISL